MLLEMALAANDTLHGTMSGLAGFGALGGLGAIRDNSPKEHIQRLQRALNDISWPSPNLKVDGIFGPKTLDAVQTFQRRVGGFVTTGYWVDDDTLSMLQLSDLEDNTANQSGDGTGGQGVNGSVVSGGGGLYFEWKCPATVYSALTWGRAQTALGQALVAANFDVQYNSYESALLSGSLWTLVVRGVSPAGLTNRNALSNRLISLAEDAGFSLSKNNATLTTGTEVAEGDKNKTKDKNDKSIFDSIQEFLDKKFGFLGGTISGAALILLGVGALFVASKRD